MVPATTVSNEGTIAVTNSSSSVSMSAGSGVLAGANFYGPTTVNVQINKNE